MVTETSTDCYEIIIIKYNRTKNINNKIKVDIGHRIVFNIYKPKR